MAENNENTFLLMNGTVVNVFTEELEKTNVLIKGSKIIGVGPYAENDADECVDVSGKFICPGFIDGHMHIESTMLLPSEFARVALVHGTTLIVADPHEIANVCGTDGINFMIESSEALPLKIYFMLPSCVPATKFDESGASLNAGDLHRFYSDKKVLGLAEVMDFTGVVKNDKTIMDKIRDALLQNKNIDGHAPLLKGRDLDKYIASGITTDHECSNVQEAIEKIKKGLWVMIREGSAARNLEALLPLFNEPYCQRCLLVTDDRNPSDLLKSGHIDNIIRKACQKGVNPIKAIKMATKQAAECFGLKYTGAVSPGYHADLLILNDLESVEIEDVYTDGKKVVSKKKVLDFKKPDVESSLLQKVHDTVHLAQLKPGDFYIEEYKGETRIIQIVKGELITNGIKTKLNFNSSNGIDVNRDILKLCVIERYKGTGHIGKGFINGIGLKHGAIASTVSHDSHNLIVIGTNDDDMAFAANCLRKCGGGSIYVKDSKIVECLPLPVAGLMSELCAEKVALQTEKLHEEVHKDGVSAEIEPFMNMAFVSLAVIPSLRMTTLGLVDVCL